MNQGVEGKRIRKELVDGLRRSVSGLDLIDADLEELHCLVKEGMLEVEGTNLFGVLKLIRDALEAVDDQWFLKTAIDKVFSIPIPGAILISDASILPEPLMAAMKGAIYVADARIIIFGDKFYYCAAPSSDFNALADEYNSHAIQLYAAYLNGYGSSRDPKEGLDRLVADSRCLSFDYDAEYANEFDSDERGAFFKLSKDWQKDLNDRLAWLKWLDTATEAEIQEQLEHDPSVFAWMVEESERFLADEEVSDDLK